MSEKTSRSDIVVAGSGPVGLIAALSLSQQGFSVVLAGPEANVEDRRTAALMLPAVEMLRRLGLGKVIDDVAAPLNVMRIIDATSRLVRSPVVTFRASEIGEPHFGLNIFNRDLNIALAAAVAADTNIVWKKNLVKSWQLGSDSVAARLSDATSVEAALAVAADGRLSPAREAAGITVAVKSLPQSALVLTFRHSRPHASISTEFHTETGPFTQVPLSGDRSSLVWVVRPDEAQALAGLDDASLSQRVEAQMRSMLGRVEVEPGRQIYPLSTSTPHMFAHNRVALVGEAAHIFPPIGAQGLNLGIRDVADLAEITTIHRTDPGSKAALGAYDAKRRPDILARSGAVNLLNHSLLSDMLPAQLARSAGLGALGAFAPLRALFMREGLRPGSGLSSLFRS